MFSEYASRFLAQSQSRISFAAGDDRRAGAERTRRQPSSGWRSSTAPRSQLPKRGNPYRPSSSQLPGLPFASRFNQPQAPLFYSATDEFREENDEEEHEREIADFYALQKSRRQLGGSDLKDSSEIDRSSDLGAEGNDDDPGRPGRGFGRGGGIRSSWRGATIKEPGRGTRTDHLSSQGEEDGDDAKSEAAGSDRGKLVDVRLGDTLMSEVDDDPPDDLIEDPPSIQNLRNANRDRSNPDANLSFMPHETDEQTPFDHPRPPSTSNESIPQVNLQPTDHPPRHDIFFGHLYLLALAAMFTTWFLVYLHTTPPDTRKPIGDTIYSTLHSSYRLLAVYTIVAIFVSLVWLAALQSYARYLVYSILVAVPTILYAFSLYPLISSYQGSWRGSSIQDRLMWWLSFVPAVMASLWIVAVLRGRLAMQKSISIVEFATHILAANPALLVVGIGVLGSIIGFTWIWLSMFTRVFLGGHLTTRSSVGRFLIDTSTWWLGVYFILVYLWTIAVIFGMQRSVSSATVSQWYFHRLSVPAPTSQTIVKAAVAHSSTTLFGTIALSTALSLLVRLPLLLLPRRLTMLLGVVMYSLIPTPIATLINPLTLTYASIHSQPLAVSARSISQLQFLAPNDATTALHPATFNRRRTGERWSQDATPLLPYRLAKLLLHATRLMMSLALGFGGWVSTARSLNLAGTDGVRGSLYAYIVGLIAGAIGWTVLGAIEGILACIVDAVVVCWGSEVGSSGQGEVRYCREAGHLFSEETEQREGRVSLA